MTTRICLDQHGLDLFVSEFTYIFQYFFGLLSLNLKTRLFFFPNECVNKLPEPVSCLLLSLDTTTVSGVFNLTITILKVIHLE